MNDALMRLRRAPAFAAALTWAASAGAQPGPDGAPRTEVALTGYYYAMRDQPDFGVGVATFDRGPLHLEARYNYEATDATSLLAGWTFSGGDALTYSVTPMIGGLFGAARGIVPGVEASLGYRGFDLYVEAEYVRDLDQRSDSYYYVWTELGWTPAQWLRIGLAGQRTLVVDSDRGFQLGAFVQLIFDKATIGVYAFNPDAGSRYLIVSAGVRF